MSQFIATTSLSAMRSVGSTAERSLQRLQVVLAREFPSGTGLELAEPVPRKDGSGIDWYTECDEVLVRLDDLPPETAAGYRSRLYQSVRAVLNAAAAREALGDPVARTTAAALRSSVTFPGQENVWIAGGRDGADGTIVLTAWGYEKHDAQTSGRGNIVGPDRPRPSTGVPVRTEPDVPSAAMVQPALTPAARLWWRSAAASLICAVPLALALLTAWLLLPACGIRLPFGIVAFGEGAGSYCALAAPLPPQVDQASAITRELRSEVAVLEEQLTRSLTYCQAAETRPPDALDQRVEERGGKTGKLQVTLSWESLDDLDLNINCPGGLLGGNDDIRGPDVCGDGVKDLDSNKNLEENVSSDPVENIVWQTETPNGLYKISVFPYVYTGKNTNKEIPFKLRIRYDGQEQTCSGFVGHKASKYLKWTYGEPLPGCDFLTEETRQCTSDCKG